MFGAKEDEMREFHNLYSSLNIVTVIKCDI
jgi:hypothetical protein